MTLTVSSISGAGARKTAEREPKFREKDAICIDVEASPAASKSGTATSRRYQPYDLQIRGQLLRDTSRVSARRFRDVALAYRQNMMIRAQQQGGIKV
ncbi:MAG: hypothetical protein EXR08_01320 [Alphaproteobacteria bacterium]|nr:hypothetical protein [Alphaproteobacteria bacterium]